MANVTFGTLDLSSPEDIAAYERAAFRAFVAVEPVLPAPVWQFDRPNRRARAPVPYKAQTVYVGRLEQRVVAGVALNRGGHPRFQLELIGFDIDADREGVAEVLVFFSLLAATEASTVARSLGEFAIGQILETPPRRLLSTCAERRLKAYEILGWQAVDELVFPKGKVFLLEYSG